ncbi:AMP-binding protein [Pseudoclavibacter sp. VKM Ac-2888]|uniref:AMP-binding protein n=1 Tax=Pseudoclavibacter sp. VKM Ac-2888 TaxID=2783830 RepID=UPI00188CED65|nr:AMP-binding protein [Pseudoclavibacter sp. VKM Ac-2888]MBF4549435.1 AMP-binding protein [Pseudoclavibacter sp. VKM Ac-2888]
MSTLLQQYFLDSLSQDAKAPAVHDGPRTYSYGELDEIVEHLMSALTRHGLKAEDRLVMWTEKSAVTVALMQAALRLGIIYVPVAPSNPISRVKQVIELARASFVVTDGPIGFATRLGSSTLDLLLASEQDVVPLAPTISPDDPAYILFTSGSTGVPKGVTISHTNARAFVDWAVVEAGVGSDDRLSSHAQFSFDLSVFDLYGAFAVGAAVDLIPSSAANNGTALAAFIRERQITVWYSVPSALMLMIDHGGLFIARAPDDLRVMIFAGEPFPLGRAKALLETWAGVRLMNWYGPTETNVCTGYELSASDLTRNTPIPIGYPASGANVTLRPGPDEGEIVVNGPSVMVGYWGQAPQDGAYATGDFGRIGVAGEIEYVGRSDGLVKIRGYRVEVGDIEAVLGLHEAIQDVAVLAVGEGTDRSLTAVVVPKGGRRVSLLGLKSHTATHLPTYMIVDRLHIVETLPRTPNGKVDRTHLAHAIGKELE